MTENLMEQLSAQNPLDSIIVTKENTPKACLANALLLLRHDHNWQGVLALNEFSLQVVTKKPAPWQVDAGGNWTDADDSKTAEWLQREGVLVATHIAAEAVQTVARENGFHPVRDYLRSLKWDGEPRLDTWLIDYMGAIDTQLARAIASRWLISAVARIFEPGCQADHVLLLEGTQGIGKSSALEILASKEWFTGNISELGTKDSRSELLGVWIVEFSELDSIRRAERERVKSFITLRADKYRPPYGRRTQSFPRSCVFAATTNDFQSLNDETGNRRFWPVRCSVVDIPGLKRDRNQIWAEAYQRYSAREPWWLDTKELSEAAAAEQEKRYEGDPWDQLIREWCEKPQHRAGSPEPCNSEIDRITVVDVLVHGIGKSPDRILQADQNRVARCLVHDGWKRKQVRIGKDRKWFYVREGDE